MNILKSKSARLMLLAALCIGTSGCAINDALNRHIAKNKRSMVPFAVEFHQASTSEATEISRQGQSIRDNLNDVLINWKTETCAKINCNNQPDIGFAQMLEGMPIARPDLNKDGKKDLVLNIVQNTGLGNCGAAEYRFFENNGTDFRPIGKAKVTRIQTLYEIDDARANEFKTLSWRAKFDCENNPIDSQDRNAYDKAKQQYYSID